MGTHCFPYRPFDYMYDPIFSVSGPIDHYKEAVRAKITTAKFQICPIFPNMFSDIPSHPRQQLLRISSVPVKEFSMSQRKTNMPDNLVNDASNVLGPDRMKFFKINVLNFPPKDLLPYRTLATFNIRMVAKQSDGHKTLNKTTNTLYTDAEVQTIPWEPPYKVIGEGSPEVLLLNFLKWGAGLPAGKHEIELIERARMKVAWEKAIRPNLADESAMTKLRDYMEALEMDEWAFREQEIQYIQDMRMELLENMLEELHENRTKRAEKKMKSIVDRTLAERDKKIAAIKKQGQRALRKLEVASRGVSNKYRKADIIDEHVDYKSEIYAPMMRHGEHPKRWHMVIDEKNKKYKPQFIGVENIETLPTWLDKATKITEREIDDRVPIRHICMRETKWTTPVLKQLHEELKTMRMKEPPTACSLLKRLEVEKQLQYTSEAQGVEEEVETQYQAVVKVQSIIRGRATQVLIYEGRDRCRKLIETLRESEGLLQAQKEEKLERKLGALGQERKQFIHERKYEQVKEILDRLQGSCVGTLLDFLNKELRRLLVKRKAHALCLSLERDLHTREAGEAGRRQRELRRRREHDEMFKQIIKVHQDTVDMYLQDIIAEGMDFASREEAAAYVTSIAKKIDEETEELYNMSSSIEGENEIVADMVHHFLLSEANKEIVRNNIILKQKTNLRAVHDELYTCTEKLPKIDRSTPESEIVRSILNEIIDTISPDTDSTAFTRDEIIYPIIDEIASDPFRTPPTWL
ncbi:cilia- and flagella-associated protein 91-like [Aethina tumida]|uniref:cilia- and flagella-associated protein 91-like n=1 Tax=Aethina tumida TaxID=116153 RepID=UPI00214778DB|nr:cilia- and flagella-associated protein 91-like [Aethina tumida]